MAPLPIDMKIKNKKPTLRSTLRNMKELETVIVRHENFLRYLEKNVDLVSEMLYGLLDMKGDVDNVVKHIEKKRKEKEDALSDGKETENLHGESNKRSDDTDGESV